MGRIRRIISPVCEASCLVPGMFWDCEEDEEGQGAQIVLWKTCTPRWISVKILYIRGTGAWPEAWFDEEPNDFFPWLWKVELLHFGGYFKENHLLTGEGLLQAQRTCKCRQQTIWEQPRKENLVRLINVWLSRVLMNLNNTEYMSDGKTLRCPIWQTSEGWGTWRYDCTGWLFYKTV